ncbi:MAG: 50S ribosomal protein L19 [Actinomycetota bacterium]|nr:50S ribosomal protein L19 [Actinomycetota bacterium]
MNEIELIEKNQVRDDIPDFSPGDTVKVVIEVRETVGSGQKKTERTRTQAFQGTVIKRQGSGARETFTVRKVSFGVGVERTFPLNSPIIKSVEVISRGDARRAKLYYLRERVGKSAKVRRKKAESKRST